MNVQSPADADKLTGTSPDFQSFISEEVSGPDSDGCQNEFTILSFHPDGYAAGQQFAAGCGGSQNVWGKANGAWETLLVMQSPVPCTDMASAGIPKGLPDISCLDSDGHVTAW